VDVLETILASAPVPGNAADPCSSAMLAASSVTFNGPVTIIQYMTMPEPPGRIASRPDV
jgi:hypothetical protein